MGDTPTRKRKYRTDFGSITYESHDGGKTWKEAYKEELPSKPPQSRHTPERTTCRHQTHGICLTCRNADTVARREARSDGR